MRDRISNNVIFPGLTNLCFLRLGTGFIPASCKKHIEWAHKTGKFREDANKWYPEMKDVTGVTIDKATFKDFQREFKCKNLSQKDCNSNGLQFPSSCSLPPCNRCFVNETGNYIEIRL